VLSQRSRIFCASLAGSGLLGGIAALAAGVNVRQGPSPFALLHISEANPGDNRI
jgi:hypothetical protein